MSVVSAHLPYASLLQPQSDSTKLPPADLPGTRSAYVVFSLSLSFPTTRISCTSVFSRAIERWRRPFCHPSNDFENSGRGFVQNALAQGEDSGGGSERRSTRKYVYALRMLLSLSPSARMCTLLFFCPALPCAQSIRIPISSLQIRSLSLHPPPKPTGTQSCQQQRLQKERRSQPWDTETVECWAASAAASASYPALRLVGRERISSRRLGSSHRHHHHHHPSLL